MGEKLYFNQSPRRKQQIYEWTRETIVDNPNLNRSFNSAKIDLARGDIQASFDKFSSIIFSLDFADPTLFYLIRQNSFRFGQNRVLKDLFNGVLRSEIMRLKISKRSVEQTKQVRRVRIEDLEKRIKEEKPRKKFGITREGKKREALETVVVVKKKPVFRLRDKKTGRFLKFTESFKKELQRRQEE